MKVRHVIKPVEALADLLGKKSPGETLTLVIPRAGKETEAHQTPDSLQHCQDVIVIKA
jgi:hypothetical protein